MALRIPPRQSFMESAGYIFAPLRIFAASGSLERFKSLQYLVRGGNSHLARNCCDRHRAIAALRARLPNFRLGLKLKFLAYLRKILYYPISCSRLRTQSQPLATSGDALPLCSYCHQVATIFRAQSLLHASCHPSVNAQASSNMLISMRLLFAVS